MISIYCDGASSGRRHMPGGYGYVIVRGDEVLAWSYGGSPSTTNNLMELEGAIQGLSAFLALEVHDAVELVSDSQYTLGIVTGAYHPTTNLAETSKLRALAAQIRGLRCRWVKGHKGDKWNEKADELASQGKLENMPAELRRLKELKNARRERRQVARAARAATSEVPTGPGLLPEEGEG